MFRVVENLIDTPALFIAAPDTKFEPGKIAQVKELNKVMVCCISDGTIPLGIIASKLSTGPFINYSRDYMVQVHCQRMIFRTDVYDKRAKDPYKTGAALFVNKRGVLTTKRPGEDVPAVGRIITGPEADRAYFEAIWF